MVKPIAEQLMMENLEKVLDKKFVDNNAMLIEAIDTKFQRTDAKIEKIDIRLTKLEQEFVQQRKEVEQRFSVLEEKMVELTRTIDKFLKRQMDQEGELIIIKAELAQVKGILKKNLGLKCGFKNKRMSFLSI